MGFRDIFKKPERKGPEVVEVKAKKPAPQKAPEETFDFSYNECRFGHNENGCYKSYPVAASLYGFFKFETVAISAEEYAMWQDCMEHPDLYVVTVENLGRGFKNYSISEKEHE